MFLLLLMFAATFLTLILNPKKSYHLLSREDIAVTMSCTARNPGRTAKMRVFRRKGMAVFVATVSTLSTLMAQADIRYIPPNEWPHENNYYGPRVSGGIFYRNHHNSAGSFGELDTMVPLWQTRQTLLFADARGLDYSGPRVEGNIGGGIRHLTNSGHWISGAYSFFDSKRSNYKNYFHSLNIGGELRSLHWFFGGNAYVPLTHVKNTPALDGTELQDGDSGFKNIFYRVGQERALGGGDFLIGHSLYFSGLMGYAGGYYFGARNSKTVAGPTFRLRYNLGGLFGYNTLFSHVETETGLSVDKSRGAVVWAGVRINAAKAFNPALGLGNYMTDYIMRDYDVVTANNGTKWTRLTNSDGSPVKVDFATTAAALTAARTAAANIIAVNGAISSVDQIVLTNGQTLMSGSYSFTAGGKALSVQLGTSGRLTSNGDDETFVVVGRDNTISGLTFNASAKSTGNGVIGNDGTAAVGNLVIRDNTITAGDGGVTGARGIAIAINSAATSNMSLTNNSITVGTGTAGTGIDIALNSTTATTAATINTLDDNTIVVGAADNTMGINVSATGDADTGSALTINSMQNNTVTLGAGAATRGVRVIATAANVTPNSTTITLNNFIGNTITVSDGGPSNDQFVWLVDSVTGGDITITTARSNTFAYAAGGAGNTAVRFQSDDANGGVVDVTVGNGATSFTGSNTFSFVGGAGTNASVSLAGTTIDPSL